MREVIIIRNPLVLSSEWEVFQTDDVVQTIFEAFSGTFPPTARVYSGVVSATTECTPKTAEEVERLRNGNSEKVYVVVYPEGVVEVIVAIVIAIVVAVATIFLLPEPSLPNLNPRANRNLRSPNNELSERTNSPRPAARIPDIYGRLLSVPDLISQPYSRFEDNVEVEIALLCVGRGSYEFGDIFDGDTKIEDISGASLAVFGPGTWPGNGSPEIQIGTAISDLMIDSRRMNEVNGQTLLAPNSNLVVGSSDIRFVSPDTIQHDGTGDLDFEENFEAGESIVVSNAAFSEGGFDFDLNGTYTILSVTNDTVTLSNPALVQPDWDDLDELSGNASSFYSPRLQTVSDKWVGPFETRDQVDEVRANFVAPQGLFKDNGDNQFRIDVAVQVEATPIDDAGTPTGPAVTQSVTLTGSSFTRDQRGSSVIVSMATRSRVSVRARRVTNKVEFAGTVVEDVKWRDLFAVRDVTEIGFGDVTIIHARTVATAGALAVKERQIRALVTRKLPQRVSGSEFTTTLHATRSAADILSAICLDPEIGNRNVDEIDFDSIYDTVEEITSYFASADAAEFAHTFDDDNTSFQEIVFIVASAIFCSAYREGRVIRLFFERQTEDSVAIFNHRNTIPETQKRTVSFGIVRDFDGVEAEAIDPDDDQLATFRVPYDGSAVNPQKVELIGVRTDLQRYLHGWRVRNKQLFSNVAVDVESTAEGALVVRGERVLITDTTNTYGFEGEITAVNALTLTLSQPCDLSSGEWLIFLWLPDGFVQAIPVVQGQDEYHVVLSNAPLIEPIVSNEFYARTVFKIAPAEGGDADAMIIEERDSTGGGKAKVKAINYDTRYYWNDRLALHVPIERNEIADESRNQFGLVLGTGLTIASGQPRGFMASNSTSTGTLTSSSTIPAYGTYTKAFWADVSGQGFAMSSQSGSEQFVGFDSATAFLAGHGATEIAATIASGLHHFAVTYDATTTTMKLFVDGVKVNEGDVPVPTGFGGLMASGSAGGLALQGLWDDMRMWFFAMDEQEITDLYRATLA